MGGILRKDIILLLLTLLFFSALSAQTDKEDLPQWVQVPSPINSDLKFITFFKPGQGIACGKQLLIYRDRQWIKYHSQPPVPVDLCFPLDTQSIFVTTITKFQESELYFGKDNHWEKVWTPLANTISALYFNDRENGIIAGMGEIALLKNNRWQWIHPPNNSGNYFCSN